MVAKGLSDSRLSMLPPYVAFNSGYVAKVFHISMLHAGSETDRLQFIKVQLMVDSQEKLDNELFKHCGYCINHQ